jgi:hypothetical protein
MEFSSSLKSGKTVPTKSWDSIIERWDEQADLS